MHQPSLSSSRLSNPQVALREREEEEEEEEEEEKDTGWVFFFRVRCRSLCGVLGAMWAAS